MEPNHSDIIDEIPEILITNSSQCLICYEIKPMAESTKMPNCKHEFCNSCLQNYICSKVQEGKLYPLSCPDYTCEVHDQPGLADLFLDPVSLEKFYSFRNKNYLQKQPNLRWCPKPNCQGYDLITEENSHLTCNTCGSKFCGKCHNEWHQGQSCKVDNVLHKYTKKRGIKPCPNCRNYVEKSSGCPSVTCTCGTRFCIKCGKLINADHKTFQCMIGGSYFNSSWTFIFLLIAMWILFPFQLGLLVIYFFEDWGLNETSQFAEHIQYFKALYYPILLLLSPVITVLTILIGGCLWGILVFNSLIKRMEVYKRYKQIVNSLIFLKCIVLTPVFIALGVSGYLLINLCLPFAGLGLLVLRFVKKTEK
ncbi:unnamed protein product [Blepharisma stoltei]|uniref:RBR-type E3 ubiquitin transferase n=1 Tax=Blepharisma stoltei TaxID=1481888 RepID=A0AAU9K3U5_9CILI|nr:unnamed protein product [Blepharisma stoltei]